MLFSFKFLCLVMLLIFFNLINKYIHEKNRKVHFAEFFYGLFLAPQLPENVQFYRTLLQFISVNLVKNLKINNNYTYLPENVIL